MPRLNQIGQRLCNEDVIADVVAAMKEGPRTDLELSQRLGVEPCTLRRWKQRGREAEREVALVGKPERLATETQIYLKFWLALKSAGLESIQQRLSICADLAEQGYKTTIKKYKYETEEKDGEKVQTRVLVGEEEIYRSVPIPDLLKAATVTNGCYQINEEIAAARKKLGLDGTLDLNNGGGKGFVDAVTLPLECIPPELFEVLGGCAVEIDLAAVDLTDAQLEALMNAWEAYQKGTTQVVDEDGAVIHEYRTEEMHE